MKASTFFLIVLSFLAGVGLILILKGNHPMPPPQIVVEVDTIPGDSIPYVVEVEVPVPVASTPDTEWRDRPIDTMVILADYHIKRDYKDTLKNDTSALIVLSESVFKNKIVDRSLIFQNLRPVAINTTIINNPVSKQKWNFLAGCVAGSLDGNAVLGGAAGVRSPNESVFTYSYDILNKGHTITLLCNPFRKNKEPPGR